MARGQAQAVVLRRLERHQLRRDEGQPTVSALSGPPASGAAAWTAWLTHRGRTGVTCTEPSAHALAGAWIEHLAATRDLGADALAAIARRSHAPLAAGMPLDAWRSELGGRLGRGTDAERAQIWQRLIELGLRPLLVALCRWLIERDRARRSASRGTGRPAGGARGPGQDRWQDLWQELWLALGRERTWAEILAEVAALVPAAELPGLLLVAEERPAMDRMAGLAEELAAHIPRLPVAVAGSSEIIHDYLGGGESSRAADTLREGTITVNGELVTPEPAAIPPDELGASLARLEAIGAGPALVRALRGAARERELARAAGAGETHAVERARRAAKRVLFAALQAMPDTAGLFALDRRLALVPGQPPVDVDIASAELRLAVHVDGCYRARDADAYRRARRKDVLVQLQDHVILRCLADDVVMALDRVLDDILAAASARRRRAPG